MEVGEGFAEAQDSVRAPDLGSAAEAPTADIAAATTEGVVTTEAVAVTAGAEGIGAEDTVTDGGAGDLALDGRIGDGGAIRMATTARTTRLTLIILTRTTVLPTIRRTIRVLTIGTMIRNREIRARGNNPTSTDLQGPGGPRYREAERTQTTQTAMPRRRVRRLCPLTG
jgi:hypothetical protein